MCGNSARTDWGAVSGQYKPGREIGVTGGNVTGPSLQTTDLASGSNYPPVHIEFLRVVTQAVL